MVLLDLASVNYGVSFLFSQPQLLLQVLVILFLAILFIQSGLDKVFDWKGNLEWLKSHFLNTPLSNAVFFLLAIVTFMEILAGMFCLIGLVGLLISNNTYFAFVGSGLSSLVILMLFFGQRIAKDYVGALGLVPYFILTIIAMYLLII